MADQALVTGSGRGTGRPIALCLAGKGYDIELQAAQDTPLCWLFL